MLLTLLRVVATVMAAVWKSKLFPFQGNFSVNLFKSRVVSVMVSTVASREASYGLDSAETKVKTVPDL